MSMYEQLVGPGSMIRPLARRGWRLVAGVAFVLAGLSYLIFPPVTATSYFSSDVPPRIWGAMMIFGGVLKVTASITTHLTIDRAGLTALAAGTAGLAAAQTMILFDFPITWTRLGGTFAYWILFVLLLMRWQDVKHEEDCAEEATEAAIRQELSGRGVL